jgi:hypothetical protein
MPEVDSTATQSFYTFMNTGLALAVVWDYFSLCLRLLVQGGSMRCIIMMVVSLPLFKPLGLPMISCTFSCFTSYYLRPPATPPHSGTNDGPPNLFVRMRMLLTSIIFERHGMAEILTNLDIHGQAESHLETLDCSSRKLVLVHALYLGIILVIITVFGSGLFLIFFPQIREFCTFFR